MDDKLEIIKGLNAEKVILTEGLINMKGDNAAIPTRGSIESRLKDIDEFLLNLNKD